MRIRVKLIVFIAVIAILAPISWALSAMAAHKKTQTPTVTPITVNVAKVQSKSIPEFVLSLGTLSASQVVTISSVAAGRISHVYFKNGQQVVKGMPIVQLDNAQAKANYESSVTELNLARTKYERSKQLLNTAISQQELDQLKASVATDKAQVKSNLSALNQLQIEAPFSGVLGQFKVQQGDYVNAGDALVTLVNTADLKVTYSVAEKLLPKLKTGELVIVTTSAYPKKKFIGTVNFISPTVNQTTRTITVQADLPNKKNLLAPGMFVHVATQIGEQQNALVVPNQAVSADVKGYFVYKVVGNKVQQVYVKIGTRRNGMVQILSGVNPGETVVTAGIQKLQDGSIIEIAPDDNGNSAAPQSTTTTKQG